MRLAFTSLLLVSTLQSAEPLPGHSAHGEAFDEGPRQAAVLIEGCGKVNFPISSSHPEAQRFFHQGLGQLHGFWYYEAERSFRQVTDLDPDCAIAFWGCAMANANNEKRAVAFIKNANEKKDKASKREQSWIAALNTFYADLKKDKKMRHMDFIKDMEGIIHDYPEDLEAKAMLGWAIWNAKEAGVSMVSRESVDAVLQQVFAKEPMHPAHHYIIHLWDDTKPSRALASAAKCGQSAPAIAHMWHMPSHTFSKTNRLVDAAWQQEAATRVDHAYMMRTQILPDQIHNYAHNTEWLVRTLSQTGQAREAVSIALNLVELPRHPKFNTLELEKSSAHHGRNRLLEVLLKYELWDEVLALENSGHLDNSQNPSFEANKLRALGVAAYFKGDKTKVQQYLKALTSLKKTAPAADKTEKTTLTSKTPDTKGVDPGYKGPPKPSVLFIRDNAIAELTALISMLEKQNSTASAKLLEAIKDNPKERLILYHLALGNKAKAAELSQRLPLDAPGLALKVLTLDACDKKEEAKKPFETLRKTGAALDHDLPFSPALGAFAVSIGQQEEWRTPEPTNKDSGERPPLDSLGPLHWQPYTAAGFALPDAKQQTVSLHDFAGKPTVVLFYLGGNCTHCMEQLKAYQKAHTEFAEAGIELVAIGCEPIAELTSTASSCQSGETPPLTLLADPEKIIFKAWRCYDDFEGLPLHGAFLISPDGKVLWNDVSAEPFMDTKFLIGEAKRLMEMAHR
jgi:peroxiredoxin